MTTDIESGAGAPAADGRKLVITWLTLVAVLVFAMIVLGGVTRLTNSGLSMTDWKPVTGWLPPLSHEAWMAEFERYKAFPEYQKINKGMSLSEFQGIYAFEFAHRVLGRIIGLAFFVPFVLLLLLRKIPRSMAPRLALLFLLGAAQGGMGWFMVKSGLVDHPDVSHYRLTAHLALASLIFAALLWTIFDLLRPTGERRAPAPATVRRTGYALLLLIALQIIIGGFVAGLNAGFVYTDWPLMGGRFLPEDFLHMQPLYHNFLENPGTVQFVHRMVGYAIAAAAIWLYLVSRGWGLDRRLRLGISWAVTLVLAQVFLGIVTLLHVVPVALGAAHQAGGMLVLAAALFVVHDLRSEQAT
ncbi:COX15/CtaA family protein [Sneathiella litorea]|uniref:Heme A synthase n=1 Tax=Sneathiella litorea TaxID=2606216 RepID=A0A6L8WA11_9PROT|nr:COX15/CtaA family protein [Sneathiella litorea]MZR31027.1 heme A synthase [Sneathiella litorea]